MANPLDDETLIGPNETALVAEESGEIRLVLPELGDDEEVPPMALLLVAVSLKLDDEEWLAETMSALDDRN